MARRVDVTENALDRAIRWIAPVTAAKRFRARAALALAGGYTGASRKRRSLSTFTPDGTSADAALLPDLADLRARSRDLARNSPLACGAINTNVTSVVGSGLTMKCAIDRKFLGLTDAEAEEWESNAERLWCLFAGSQECDATRTQDFAGIQSLAYRSTCENGDAFTLLPFIERAGSPFGLKVQLIEADRVENEKNVMNTDRLAGGVQLDAHGAPVAYHILRTHPGAIDRKAKEWDVVPAFGSNGRRNVLHHFERRRIAQNRGVPYLAPVIESLKQISDYTEAELMAAVVSGMFTVFIKSESGEADLAGMTPNEGNAKPTDDDYKLGNGAIVGLAPGDDIVSANPGRPNALFDPFVMSILRQVGVALEIPFEVLIKHFTASYSAARAALLEAWRFFKVRRAWLVGSLCQPVYEALIYECVARGLLYAPGYLDDPMIRYAYCKANWIGRPMGHIQPQQEAQAMQTRIDIGVSNREKEAAEYDGSDWERDVHPQLAKEARLRASDGMDQSVAPDPAEDSPATPKDPHEPDPAEEYARTVGADIATMGEKIIGSLKGEMDRTDRQLLTVLASRPQEAPRVEFHKDAISVHIEPTSVTIAENAVRVDVDVAGPEIVAEIPPASVIVKNMPVPDARMTVERDVNGEMTGSVTRALPS